MEATGTPHRETTWSALKAGNRVIKGAKTLVVEDIQEAPNGELWVKFEGRANSVPAAPESPVTILEDSQ